MTRLAERAWKRAGAIGRASKEHTMPVHPTGMAWDRYARWTLLAIVVMMAFQATFLLVGCNWDFCGDEAEYWSWSRRLDWSYYTRGPLIAWVIRLGTTVFGGASLALTGSLMAAARMPAVLVGGLTVWGIFRLTELTTGSRRTAMVTALLMPAIPVFAVGGVIITSDTPLVCCWIWMSVWALRAIRSEDLRAWIAAGVIGALGVLAKYTILALPASIGLYLLLSHRHRRTLIRPGFWIMAILCIGLGMAPIAAWNARHGWAAADQLANRLGFSDLARWGTLVPVLSFLGGEAAVLAGVWWAAGIAALRDAARVVRRSEEDRSPGDRPRLDRDAALFLICIWGVLWCTCLAASFLGETEANWMAPGYVGLLVLIGWRVDAALARGGRKARVYVGAWCATVAVIVAFHHTDWFYPIVGRFVPAPTSACAAPLRLYDVTARMRGHQELARAVERKLENLRASGEDPFVLTPTYALAATLEFYLPGQPQTYCLSWNYGMTPDPVNQHDLWHPNPRNDIEAFQGRTLVVVEDANMPPSYSTHLSKKGVVGECGPVERIAVKEHGLTVGAWDITVCRDYQGIAEYKQNAMYRASDPRALRDPLSRRQAEARRAAAARSGQGRAVDTPRGAR